MSSEAESVIEERRPPSDWPHEGAVVYKDYRMRYRPGLALALRGVNCHIKAREKIGIVGRTGSGEITFM